MSRMRLGNGVMRAALRMSCAILASLCTAAVALAGTAAADGRLGATFRSIDQAVASVPTPGIVIGITDRKQLQTVIVHGYADLKKRTPLTRDSPFPIGSISKSFTAVMLMELKDEGRFDPRAPIEQYLPGFALKSHFRPVTGRDLLSHTSGLPLYRADMSSSRDVVAALRDFEPSYAPGTHYWYSDIGFQVLGYAIERIVHAPYRTVMAQRVFAPLGMMSTRAIIDDPLRARLPVSYIRWPYDGSYVEYPWFEYAAADGSIVSTAADMCAYARFILNRGAGPHGRVISEPSFTALTTPVLQDYAYGLQVHEEKGTTVIEHSGGMAGFHSLLVADMTDGFGVMFLSNFELDHALTHWVVEAVRAAYRNEPEPARVSFSSAAKEPAAAEYAGRYRSLSRREVEFASGPHGLLLKQSTGAVPLVPMGHDTFRTLGAAVDPFPYVFGRVRGPADSSVVEVSHGAEWFTNARYRGTTQVSTPAEYLAYVGHYENHNAEGPVARVYVQGVRLMALVDGEVPSTDPQTLKPLGSGVFQPAKPDPNPERYQFDTVVDGQALRLLISGTPLYRVETP
jgi:D-alanyl-D-alanine carboxypeptidase